MVKCIFCGKDEAFMRGTNLIKNDGSVNYFCSNKCRKNTIKLGRDKRKFKWTEAYRIKKEKGEEKIKAEKAKAEKKKE
ncbi:MAG: 50S ribosomal protein L24e [archaeon]|nr:50S ribosomal protein L24e [archaeon]